MHVLRWGFGFGSARTGTHGRKALQAASGGETGMMRSIMHLPLYAERIMHKFINDTKSLPAPKT